MPIEQIDPVPVPITPALEPTAFPSFRAGVLVVLALAAGAVALTWPLALELDAALPGDFGDPLLNATILGWNMQWLFGLRDGAFWDVPIFHPHRNTLAYSEHLIGQTLFAWPVFAVTGNPLLTYNVVLLVSFVVCGVASYLWLHALTGRRDVALVFACALTFSPFRMGAQFGRLQMLAMGWLPLAMWAIHRYGRTRRVRYWSWLVVSLVLLVLSNMYMLFLAAVPIAAATAYAIAERPARRGRLVVGFALALAVAGALLLPVVQRYRAVDEEIGLVHDDDHAADYSAHLTSYTSVHASSPWLPWVRTENTGDQALYPGLVLLLPTAIVAIAGVRRSLGDDGRRLALLYAAVGACALWLSFGPEIRTADATVVATSPYAWLRDYVPGISAVRAPGRFAAVVSLSLAAIGALAAAAASVRLRPNVRAALATAAIGLVAIEAWPAAMRLEPMAPDGRDVDRALYDWLARQPAGGLLELPASPINAQVKGVELFHQFSTLQHPHRLVNGYSGFNSPVANLLERGDSPFVDLRRLPEGMTLLHSIGVRFVIVHQHDYATPGLAAALVALMQAQPGVRMVHEVAGHVVFELAAAPPARAHLWPSHRCGILL